MEGRYIYCCLVYVNDYLYFAAGKRTNEPGHIVSIRHNSFSDTRKSRDKQLLDEVKYRHIIIIIFWRYLFVCFCAVNILDIFMLLIDEPLLIKYVQSIFSSYFKTVIQKPIKDTQYWKKKETISRALEWTQFTNQHNRITVYDYN